MEAPSHDPRPGIVHHPIERRSSPRSGNLEGRPMKWKLPIALVLVGGAVALVAFNGRTKAAAKDVWTRLAAAALSQSPAAHIPPIHVSTARDHWDGFVALSERQEEGIGLAVATVKAQSEPIKLEVNGSTDYDPNAQSQVRARFKSRIDKVYVEMGQTVKTGDPLVDIFSQELAAAKSDYEKTKSQWEHDRAEMARSERLYKPQRGGDGPSISEKEYLVAKNDEKKSRAEHKLSAEALMVYGLTDEQIQAIETEQGVQKAMFTLRAPASGTVIRRDVVKGNIYEATDVLLTIAPLDHFWVWGNVYPHDASRVQSGQAWVINLTFLGRTVRSQIDSITSDIDKDTHTLRIRTTIKNEGGRIKAGMLVSSYVEIPPTDGCTVIPRLAMVSADGSDFVFVRRPPVTGKPDQFERRPVRVVQEYHDQVFVAGGLSPGEVVATKGSLILAQIYEDAATVATGQAL
jgi:cobalt-zinc-cadmium efflux system membrane fusion protein